MDNQFQTTEYFRLSPQQAAIIKRLKQEGNAGLWLQYVTPLDTTVSESSLTNNLHRLIEQHEILRTSFVQHSHEIVQQVNSSAVVALNNVNFSEHDEPELVFKGYCEHLMSQPLEGDKTEHLQVNICQLANEHRYLIVQASALIADRYSFATLTKQLMSGVDTQEVVQYADITEWFYEVQQGNPEHSLHWARIIAEKTQDNPLSDWQQTHTDKRSDYQQVTCQLPSGLFAKVNALAADLNTSIESVLTACWYVDIAKTSGKDAFLLWYTVSVRQHQELLSAQGPFVKQVPVTVRTLKEQTWIDLCQAIHTAITKAEQGQEQFDVSTMPDTLHCGVETTQQAEPVAKGYHLFALSLSAVDEQAVTITFDGKYHTQEQAYTLGCRFAHLLSQLVEQPQMYVSDSVLLGNAEVAYLHNEIGCNDAQPVEQTIVQTLLDLAAVQPSSNAIQYGDNSITYEALLKSVNQTALWLKEYGVKPEDRVGVYADTRPELLISWFAIMSLGAAYITLESSMDHHRQSYILEDSGVKTLVCIGDGYEANNEAIQILHYERDVIEAYVNFAELPDVTLEQSAYCIYTSGSTGKPKGVEISHRALATYANAAASLFPHNAQKTFTFLAGLTADLGYTSIYGALSSGNSVRLLDSRLKLEADLLCEQLMLHPVDYLKVVPSHFQALMEATPHHQWLPRCGIVFGGEALSVDLVKAVKHAAPDLRIINHYGPTETTVGAVFNEVDVTQLKDTVAIGRPLPGYRTLILDEQQQPVALAMQGELYIGGDACAKGYLNNVCATQERFVYIEGHRYYRTGDAVYFDAQERIVFVGRLDNQVKIRGYRLELEEVERVLKNLDYINEVCVVVAGEASAQHLIAFINSTKSIDSDSLKKELGKHLPEAFLPSKFIPLTDFPRTASNKIDRVALTAKSKALLQVANPQGSQVKQGSIAEQLSSIWQVSLKQPIGPQDNYFDLGANSLLVIKVRKQIKAELHVDIKLTDFFKYTTISALAQFIEDSQEQSSNASAPQTKEEVSRDNVDSRRIARQRRKVARGRYNER